MFGKTVKAVRERVDIKLVNIWPQAAFQIKKPTYWKLNDCLRYVTVEVVLLRYMLVRAYK
jgi:hypothetical protein